MTVKATQYAKDLVRFASVTPDCTPCLEYMQQSLEKLGFTCQRLPFSGDDSYAVDNLYATIGQGSPHILFAGHVDVVPTGDENLWTYPPFDAIENDGVIYGRGMCDMKGAIACFISAVSRMVQNPFTGKISLLITGDEESDAINGTVKMLQALSEQGEKWDGCITGEPTNVDSLSDAIKNGRRGSYTGTLTVEGIQGHVGYPHLAQNACHTLISVLEKLKDLELDSGNKFFDASTLQIVDIEVPHSAGNLIPGQAKAIFNIRFSSEFSGDSLHTRISHFLQDNLGDTRYNLTHRVSAESFLTVPKKGGVADVLSQSILDITGTSPSYSTAGGTSDSRFITHYCDVVDYGLIGKTIHSIDENASVADLEQLSVIYQRFLERFFNV